MKKGTVLITIGLLLIVAALFLTGSNIWETIYAGRAAEYDLQELLKMIDDDPIPPEGRVADGTGEMEFPDYVLNPDIKMPVKRVGSNEYIGVIKIPSLNLHLPVHSSWNYNNLTTAPCRYTGSVYKDNMVLCAHNYSTHFGLIKQLHLGDKIKFVDVDGNKFKYQVIEVEILEPTDVKEMKDSEGVDLTLFTCTIGGATRVTVRCRRVAKFSGK